MATYTRIIGTISSHYTPTPGTSYDATLTFKLKATYTQNATNNTTNNALDIEVTSTDTRVPFKVTSWSITGTGGTKSGSESGYRGDERTIGSASKTISHGLDGTCSFTAGASVTVSYYTGTGTSTASKTISIGNAKYTMPTINVYSTIAFSSTSPTMTDSVTMTITKASCATSGVRIQALYDGTTVAVYEGTSTSTSWTVPDLATTTTDSETKPIIISIQSKKNSTYYDAKTYTLNAGVPSSYLPSIQTFSIDDDIAGLPDFIVGYSKLIIRFKPREDNDGGAKVVSAGVEVRENNSSGTILYAASTPWTVPYVPLEVVFGMDKPITTTTTYVKVYTTDSRGRTVSTATNVTALAYNKPTVSLSAYRCDSGGTASQFGTYVKVTVTWSITHFSTNLGNIRTYESTGGAYTQVNSTGVGGNAWSGSYSFIVSGLPINTAATFYATNTDRLDTTTSASITVPKAQMPLSLYDDGTDVGVTIGQIASSKDFNVNLETTHTQRIFTSFKSSVATGSYQATATTITNLCNEIRFSSGCVGSADITTALTYNNVTIPVSWYNFMYAPHRSGGVNGSASGDNCNYGTLLLMGMTGNDLIFKIRISGSSPYYNSIQRLKFWNTTRTDTYYLTALTGMSRSANYLRLHVPIPSGYTSATATANGDCTVYKADGTYFQATPDLITVLDVNAASVTLDIKFNGLLTTNTLYCFRNGKINITLS